MALPDDYMPALELLAEVFGDYHRRTGGHAVLVGGAATAIYTDGVFPSADFDIVAAASDVFNEILLAHGFQREERTGRLRMRFYHPDHPRYGFQQGDPPTEYRGHDRRSAWAVCGGVAGRRLPGFGKPSCFSGSPMNWIVTTFFDV